MVDEQLVVQMQHRAGLFGKLVARFGRGVLDVVHEHTIESTKERLEAADLDRRDLDTVMEILWDRMVEGTEFEVVERSDRVLRLRVTKCLFAEEMRRLGAADIGNAFYCAYDFGFCEGLNPSIRFTRTKTLMDGDDCCNHAYELKGE
jgi:hypothetical protein